MATSKLRTLQIIAASLILGVLLFAVIVFFVTRPTQLEWSALAWIEILITAAAVVASIVVTRTMNQSLEHRLQHGNFSLESIESNLQNGIAQQTLVGASLLESAAILILILNFAEPNLISGGCVLVLLGCMAFYFPTDGGVRQWLAARREAVTGRREF